MSILDTIKSRAAALDRCVVLPEGDDPRVLCAAAKVREQGFARVTVLGDPTKVEADARQAGADLQGVTVLDPADPAVRQPVIEYVATRRAKRPLTPEQADKRIETPLKFAMALVQKGDADGVVGGCTVPTADVVTAAIRAFELVDGIRTPSSSMLMAMENNPYVSEGALLFADIGLVPDPKPRQLAEIAVASARTYAKLSGNEPRVAMLSYSTKGSAGGPLVEKVLEALDLARDLDPDLTIDGELQLDSAIVPEVAKIKLSDSPVAGQANVLVFPELNAGNIGYKLTERLAGARALGPIIQGMSRPVNDLSRGCSADDIADLCAIAAVMSA